MNNFKGTHYKFYFKGIFFLTIRLSPVYLQVFLFSAQGSGTIGLCIGTVMMDHNIIYNRLLAWMSEEKQEDRFMKVTYPKAMLL